jgi:hypothetical protein
MEKTPKERRHLSHHALVESAIRMTKQLASSNDIMTRSLANRMFSDLTLLRRGLPNRRQHESAHATNPESDANDTAAEITESTSNNPNACVPGSEHPAPGPGPIEIAAAQIAAAVTPFERHLEQTRERIKAQPTVLCLYKRPEAGEFHEFGTTAAASPLQIITPEGKPLGLLDFGENTDSEPALPAWQRRVDATAQCASRQTRAVYCSDWMADPGAFSRYCQSRSNPVEWLLHVPDQHPLSRNEKFWAGITAGEMLGEAEFTTFGASASATEKNPMRLWARRAEIPSEDDARCWATCVVAQSSDAAPGARPLRMMTNREIPDLGHAAELVSWQRTLQSFEQFAAVDHELFFNPPGPAARHLDNWRMAQLAWHLEQHLEVDASEIFSSEEIRAAHLLAGRGKPGGELPLAAMLTILVELGGMRSAETKLNAGLRRLADAVAGMELANGRGDAHSATCSDD